MRDTVSGPDREPERVPVTLPQFDTEEEARDFWERHDSAPYWDQMEDVTNSPPADMAVGPGRAGSRARKRPPPGQMDLISLRLPAEMIDAVKAIAVVRHIPYQTLMRSWIGERLAQEQAREEPTP